jgi:hypothetical protein
LNELKEKKEDDKVEKQENTSAFTKRFRESEAKEVLNYIA